MTCKEARIMTDKKRDLHADLALCEAATPGPWEYHGRGYTGVAVWRAGGPGHGSIAELSPVNFGDKRQWAECENNARFIAEAREGWPHAIRRALEAEAERDELRKIVSSECPIDALDIVESLRVEKWHTQERIAELEAEIERLKAQIEEMKDEVAVWKKIALGFDKFQEGEE